MSRLGRWIRDYLNGQTTRGVCGDCGHGAVGVPGCGCPASWCPCHRTAYGHGGHGCDNEHNRSDTNAEGTRQ